MIKKSLDYTERCQWSRTAGCSINSDEILRRGDRVAEGVALEMLCTPWVPRVRIPPSPPFDALVIDSINFSLAHGRPFYFMPCAWPKRQSPKQRHISLSFRHHMIYPICINSDEVRINEHEIYQRQFVGYFQIPSRIIVAATPLSFWTFRHQ